MAARGTSRRDDRFDFLRGLALLVIFIDHVPDNWIEPFTLHSFAFSDAAEVFFFISGYVAALVYGRLMLRDGFVAAARKVWRRAVTVYGAQMALLIAVVSLVGLALAAGVDDSLRWMFRVQYVYDDPLTYFLPALTLHYQPGYLDILPAYVVLLAVFPAVLWGMSRNLWAVLVPSFALWLGVQLFGWALWNIDGTRWFFNPFAWQFLFVSGAVFGHPANKGKFAFLDSVWVWRVALAIALPVMAIQMSDTLLRYLPFLPHLRPDTAMLDKSSLGVLRLISFFALAIVVRRLLPGSGDLSAGRWTQPIIRCGRYSLQVFSFGVLLASVAAVFKVVTGGPGVLQTLAAIAGVVAQLAFGAWQDKRREDSAEELAVRQKLAEGLVFPSADPPLKVAVRAEVQQSGR